MAAALAVLAVLGAGLVGHGAARLAVAPMLTGVAAIAYAYLIYRSLRHYGWPHGST